jgi:hypothetical protein
LVNKINPKTDKIKKRELGKQEQTW